MQRAARVQRAAERHALSVSSVGSEAMQQWIAREARELAPLVAFSILGRIGGDATEAIIEELLEEQKGFQYPRSDRRRCNIERVRTTIAETIFQYPRSDRRRCNLLIPRFGFWAVMLSVSSVGSEAMQLGRSDAGPGSAEETFSILGRIGGDATQALKSPVCRKA